MIKDKTKRTNLKYKNGVGKVAERSRTVMESCPGVIEGRLMLTAVSGKGFKGVVKTSENLLRKIKG